MRFVKYRLCVFRSLEGDLHSFQSQTNSNNAMVSAYLSHAANYSNLSKESACVDSSLAQQNLPPADPQTRPPVGQVANLNYAAFRDLSSRRSDLISSSSLT